MYRLVEENELKRLIEGNMIFDRLCAQGVDNYFVYFPDDDEIEIELDKYDKFEVF